MHLENFMFIKFVIFQYNMILLYNKSNTKRDYKVGGLHMVRITDYVYFGDYSARIQELADMSPEQWSFNGQTENGILKNYLYFTLNKLLEENKVIETTDYAVFNTGLFTEFYEPIYFYMEPNTASGSQKWYLKQIATEYNLGYYGVAEMPERANYFQNPELLVFDSRCKINVHFRHILQDADNVARMPEEIRNSSNMQSALIGAIDIMKKRVTANYKIAVPQYFDGKIQLLLPLYLLERPQPDLALVVTKNTAGNYYQGHTCLTMQMAYNNARLIAKPDSNWLVP